MDEQRKNEVLDLLNKVKDETYSICIFGAGYIGKNLGRELLRIYGIEVDFYCDNNQKLWNEEIISGKYCKSLPQLKEKTEKTVCLVATGMRHMEDVVKQLELEGVKNIITSVELVQFQKVREHFFPFMKQTRVAVYTCILGGV